MNKKTINSCYQPYNVNNPYVENIKSMLESNNITTISIKKCLLSIKVLKDTKIFNLNWFENIGSKGKITAPIEYLFKCIILWWLKVNNKKIIYTLHNKLPHNTTSNKLSIKMMKKLSIYSDKIVIMCEDSKDVLKSLDIKHNINDKIIKIEHPSYLKNYKDSEFYSLREKYDLNEDLVFLFIGAISPYKNIELLIKIFKEIKYENIKLIIAGKPKNEEYKNNLLKEINNSSNIITNFKYIPEDEIGNYYKTSDIVVLPYNKNNSLNSGSVYLSFTFAKTIICPNIGTINELKDKDFVFNYDYSSDEEHLEELRLIIHKVYDEFLSDKKTICDRGKRALNYVKKYHDYDEISKKYNKLYTDLVN